MLPRTTAAGGYRRGFGTAYALRAEVAEYEAQKAPKMRATAFVCCMFMFSVAGSALVGCGANIGTPPQTSGYELPSSGSGYRLLFAFAHRDKGPQGLTAYDGLLYGTTSRGGRYHAGTFYSVTPSGERQTLHDFSGKNGDGSPRPVLIPLGGLFYGWADSHCDSPSSSCGDVFSLDTFGHERIIHVFREGRDGSFWISSMTALNGVLFGTTANGAVAGPDGTVFSLTPSGDLHELYRFKGLDIPSKDGNWPDSVVALNGMLYGTTIYGGKNGNGTVFSVTASGKERVIYSFGSAFSGDGAGPNGVTVLHGALYGTTWAGGSHYSCWGDPPIGCGAVFSVTPAGIERVLYSFPASEGNPQTNLAAMNGELYGTVGDTLFSITTTGTMKTLLSVKGCSRGPCSVLAPLKGTLYGTTPFGGKYHHGSAFAFTP